MQFDNNDNRGLDMAIAMMQVMKEIGGVEMPEYLAKMTPDGEESAEETSSTSGNGSAETGIQSMASREVVTKDLLPSQEEDEPAPEKPRRSESRLKKDQPPPPPADS